ncbi:MAG TPA: hypothetical protein VND43_02720 [Burkholderiales bacterium]|nr:transcriptional regulator [Pseudomonadota bacterium]HVC49062.1 hypothetical protein [Burkholderiales bacterium]
MAKASEKVINPRDLRRRLGINQQEFWNRIGVTQSGGSRYESGRPIPKPVKELLRLIYVEQLDLSSLCKEDIEMINFLKKYRTDFFQSIRRDMKEAKRQLHTK